MESKEIILSDGEKVEIHEVRWVDVFSEETRKLRETKSYQHVMLKLSTNLSDEKIEELNMKDGNNLFKLYMELNESSEDFQKPQEKEEKDLEQP